MEIPDTPESAYDFVLGTQIRKEISDAGGYATFLRTQANQRLSPSETGVHDIYRANYLQMERIARAVAAPRNTVYEVAGAPHANAFYWGELMGLELGERVFYEEWSDVLYKKLSMFYYESLALAHDNQLGGYMNHAVGLTAPSEDTARALLTANLLVGSLESEESSIPLPDEFESLRRDFVDGLGLEGEERRFAELGFGFVLGIFAEHAVNVAEDEGFDKEEEALGDLLDNVEEWDVFRKGED